MTRMNNPKHTPGPWYAERHGGVSADVGGVRRQVAAATGDAIMHGDPAISLGSIQAANARLIAAAPELLEALLRVLMWAPRSTEAACEQDYAAARAAIAKARGQ